MSLSDLSDLEALYLSKNKLSGSIPSELGDLSNLEALYLNSNDLDSLPDFSMSSIASNIIVFDVSNNRLDFTDIVPNVGVLSKYSPQGLLDDREHKEIKLGSSVVISVSDRHAGNDYVWYKDGQVIENSNNWGYRISSFDLLDEGDYYVEVRNVQCS